FPHVHRCSRRSLRSRRSSRSPSDHTDGKRSFGWRNIRAEVTGSESRHVIAKLIYSIALCKGMQAALIVFFEQQSPTFSCAAALCEGEAAEDGACTADGEMIVLALISQIAIGAMGDVLGQELAAMLRQMYKMKKRDQRGLLGGRE